MTEFPLDPQQHPDLTDFIAELNKANVDYLVVITTRGKSFRMRRRANAARAA